jgi:hypothetical protein
MKYLIISILFLSCCNTQKKVTSGPGSLVPNIVFDTADAGKLHSIAFDTSWYFKMDSVTVYQISVCDSSGCVSRTEGGKWQYRGDCNNALDILLREYLRLQQERDSIQKKLNYFLNI